MNRCNYDGELKKESLDCINRINKDLEKSNRPEIFNYEWDGYYIVTPTSIVELIDEEVSQDIFLMKYVEPIVSGKTNVVFVRKKGSTSSYITLEIKNGVITQASKKDCLFLLPKDYEFLEKFGEEKHIHFDPRIILRAEDYDYREDTFLEEDEPEIFAYLDGFRKKYGELDE